MVEICLAVARMTHGYVSFSGVLICAVQSITCLPDWFVKVNYGLQNQHSETGWGKWKTLVDKLVH